MRTTMQQIVDAARQKANVQRSRFVTDDEILAWANDARSELTDLFAASNQGYFSRSASFSFDAGLKTKSLASITTGIPDDCQTSLLNFTLLAGTVAAVTTLQHLYTFTSSDFPTFNEEITEAFLFLKLAYPASSNLGTDTTFSIEVNGVVSTIAAVVPAGSSSQFSDDAHYVRISLGEVDPVTGLRTGTDTVKIVCTSVATPVTPWGAFFRVDFRPIQPASKFYKELALSYGSASELVEVTRLDSLADRNRVSGPRYWIGGETLEVFSNSMPPNPWTLDYVPTFQLLKLTDEIEVQFDRWVDYVIESCVGDIKFKRNLLDEKKASDANKSAMAARIIASLPKRANGPKKIPMQVKDIFNRGFPRRRW